MSEHPSAHGHISTSRAVRHHLAVVIVYLAVGVLAGWLYAASMPTTYTSTTRVLVNPSVGNPFVPTPSSVRQDELTSLETEAQVAHSAEVLGTVAEGSSLTIGELERGLQVTVPPNTQIVEITYSASDPVAARQIADAVANAYLANRDRRFNEVNDARIERVETRTQTVVAELRAAAKGARRGTLAERLFERKLADALRDELVSLRAQRTSLENIGSPAGTVIAPASSPKSSGELTAILIPLGGALAGLALGCLLAVGLERLRGVVRSAPEVEAIGLPVVAAVPPAGWRARLLRRSRSAAVDTTIRRLRATVLDLDPRPNVIAVAPAGPGESDAKVSETVAESFAKAGHRVVLVKTDGRQAKGGLEVEERGLAQALLHERLDVLDLLQPSVDPLLSLLPDGGFTAQSRELLIADRLRAVLSPLIEAGHLVVIQAPGIDSAEGEAIVGATDLGLIVVTRGRTRPREVEQVTTQARTRGVPLAGLVVGKRDLAHHAPRVARSDVDSDAATEVADTQPPVTQGRR